MNDKILLQLAAQYGTPTYIFDVSSLKDRVHSIKEIFGPEVTLCYSIKANPFLIPAMLDAADRLEVCSPGELQICEALYRSGQVPKDSFFDRIVYSGVCKTEEDIEAAVRDGAGIYTAESIPQFKLLHKAAAAAGKTLPVLLRLESGAQFGMSREDLFRILDHRDDYPCLSVEGLHYFAGTQRKKTARQIRELDMLRDLFSETRCRYGIAFRRLEYGPGLAVPLFEGEDFSDTLAPAREIAAALKSACGWADVTVEMGRFFVTECGYYLTRVMERKHSGEKKYALVDGGIHHVNYAGQIMGMKVPVIRHLKPSPSKLPESDAGSSTPGTAQAESIAICGSLCTTNDDLVREITITDLAPGDLLAFCNIGAYSVTEGIYLFLSRTMPRIVLYNSEQDIQLARDRVESSRINTIGFQTQ